MSEEQVRNFTVHKIDLSDHDTGGGFREVDATITIDSSLPVRRQEEALIYEMLGVYIGLVVSVDDIGEMASTIAGELELLRGKL